MLINGKASASFLGCHWRQCLFINHLSILRGDIAYLEANVPFRSPKGSLTLIDSDLIESHRPVPSPRVFHRNMDKWTALRTSNKLVAKVYQINYFDRNTIARSTEPAKLLAGLAKLNFIFLVGRLVCRDRKHFFEFIVHLDMPSVANVGVDGDRIIVRSQVCPFRLGLTIEIVELCRIKRPILAGILKYGGDLYKLGLLLILFSLIFIFRILWIARKTISWCVPDPKVGSVLNVTIKTRNG